MHYFTWTVNSTSCQQYSVQCTAAVAVPDGTMCSIRHTVDHSTPTIFSIPLNVQTNLPYISQPDTVHDFEFLAMAQDYLLIKESIRRTGQLSYA